MASKTSYQGGPFVDILTGHGKSPLDEFKITPPTAVQKVFDKNVKGFVFDFHGGAVAKMQIPKDEKHTLNLVQPFIVFQVMIPHGQPFSIEFCISDGSKSKRRVHLSTAFNKPDSTPLHARIPLSFVQHGVWLNLCFDLISLVNNNFRGQSFRSLDLIVIHPSCTLRRIFTLRDPPFDTTDDGLSEGMEIHGAEPIPHTHEIPADVGSYTQLFTMEKLFYFLQLQQLNQQQQQQSPPQPETSKTAVPLAFGRRVTTAKGGTQQQQPVSPPLAHVPQPQPPYSSYPSSPQTPNTRLAAKSKVAVTKPPSAAILTKPITGRLPKVGSTGSTKSNNTNNNNNYTSSNTRNNLNVDKGGEKFLLSPNIDPKRNNSSNNNNSNNHNYNGVDSSISDYRPHRNITPVPPNPIFNREPFSEVPPRSASPEIPRTDADDEEYVDGSSYYGSDDEEFPVQNFDGVSFQKEYQSSRYQSNDSNSAGSDRATSAMSNLSLNPPYSYTSHINTKPVKKEEQIEFDDWNSLGNTSINRLSTDTSQDISLTQMEGLHRISSTTRDSLDTRPATGANNSRPPTSSPTSSSRPPTSSSRPPTSSTRPSTSIRPPTSSSRPPASPLNGTSTRPPTSSSRPSSTRPPTSSTRPPTTSTRPSTTATTPNKPSTPTPTTTPTTTTRPPTSARPPTTATSRVSTAADKQRLKTPIVNPIPLDDKSPSRGQTAPTSGRNAISGISVQKPSTADGQNSARGKRERQNNMDILAKTVEESEIHRGQNVRTSKSNLDNVVQSGSRRNSMETVYSRLVAESTLPGLRKDLGSSPHEEEEEDDMVNMGEEGEVEVEYDEDEFAGDTRDMDRGSEGDMEEGEIDEEIDEDNYEEGEDEEEGSMENEEEEEEVAEDLDNSMDKSDFMVESGGQGDNESDDEGEGNLIFDSANNAYYDTNNKKFVHLH